MGLKQKPIPAALTPFLEGKVLLLDKPIGWTSFNMVQKVRHLTKVAKVGHAGTLDPLATDLLIICTFIFYVCRLTNIINQPSFGYEMKELLTFKNFLSLSEEVCFIISSNYIFL